MVLGIEALKRKVCNRPINSQTCIFLIFFSEAYKKIITSVLYSQVYFYIACISLLKSHLSNCLNLSSHEGISQNFLIEIHLLSGVIVILLSLFMLSLIFHIFIFFSRTSGSIQPPLHKASFSKGFKFVET